MDPKIRFDLESSYGISSNCIIPVAGGWLNQKWKIYSNDTAWLVKQFSLKRFQKEKIIQINDALHRQVLLEKYGIPCPHIFLFQNQPIRMLEEEIFYMVMRFCPGKIENHNTITREQMKSLGNVCGQMHRTFSQISPQGVKGFPIHSNYVLSSLWKNHFSSLAQLKKYPIREYVKTITGQIKILQTLTTDFFDRLPKGIAHEDFSPDNMLFFPDKISVLLDFDRNQYSFIWHDIGRAILSFALKNSKLDLQIISSFLQGYNKCIPFTAKDLIDALKITWCLEIFWWVQPEVYENGSPKILRFKDEMVWMTDHWFDLETILLPLL